jgi:hypothetical protein
MSQELEEGKSSYPDTTCTGQAQGRSWIRFGFLKAKNRSEAKITTEGSNSAEVIVGGLRYELCGKYVEVFRLSLNNHRAN